VPEPRRILKDEYSFFSVPKLRKSMSRNFVETRGHEVSTNFREPFKRFYQHEVSVKDIPNILIQ